MAKGERYRLGGIAALVSIAEGEHRRAIEYDLITRAGLTLHDIPARLSWNAFLSFVTHLSPDSAYFTALNPDDSAWATRMKTNAILADVFDAIEWFSYSFRISKAKRGSRPKKPKPYPRPGQKTEDTRIGKDPIPISKFDEWWDGGEREWQETSLRRLG